MAAIWAEVFQLSQVGIHDNFFDLGGHSLNALRLFSLIRDRLKRSVQLADLFLRPTIAQLIGVGRPTSRSGTGRIVIGAADASIVGADSANLYQTYLPYFK